MHICSHALKTFFLWHTTRYLLGHWWNTDIPHIWRWRGGGQSWNERVFSWTVLTCMGHTVIMKQTWILQS
jgi:hypothetical protein